MATELFFDITSQAFVQSVAQPVIINPPAWYVGDIKHLSVKFVRRTSTNAVSVVDGTGVTMQMAIGTPASSPDVDTSATAASADSDNFFAITLLLNVADIVSTVGSSLQVTRTLEFMLTVAGEPERYQTQITLKQRLISGTLVDPAPPDVAVSSAQMLATMVPRNGALTGYENSEFYMVDSENTSRVYALRIRAGQLHVEEIS